MTAISSLDGLSKDVLLVDLPVPRDDKWIAKLQARYPGFEIRWRTRGHPMGPPPEPLPKEDYEGVTILFAYLPHPPELLSKVRYVQLISAGADKWADHPIYKNPDVVFCTSNGTHPPQIAEWVIGSYLMMSHHFLTYAADQREAKYHRHLDLHVQDTPGMRMGILGYGAIGRQVAKVAQAMGMEIYAYTRSEKSTPESRYDDSYCVPGTGDPHGLVPTKWFHGGSKGDINSFLAQDLDILVLSLPLTEETRHILGPEQFEILSKKKTFVSNIARGPHIDQDALIDALKTGKIRGAALDVTDPEPLPDGHPLYSAPNIFITPHVSWQSPHYFTRVQAIIERNLASLAGDGTKMINVMDKSRGY